MYFHNLQVNQQYGELWWHEEKENWEAGTSVESRAAVDPLSINLEDSSEEAAQPHLNKGGK
jgi:hypothetical protein